MLKSRPEAAPNTTQVLQPSRLLSSPESHLHVSSNTISAQERHTQRTPGPTLSLAPWEALCAQSVGPGDALHAATPLPPWAGSGLRADTEREGHVLSLKLTGV